MNVRLPTTRTVSRDGVNAAQTFFEHNGCVFQQVAQQNDFGKDAYVDLSNDGAVTSLHRPSDQVRHILPNASWPLRDSS
jgi:hypothetical protein